MIWSTKKYIILIKLDYVYIPVILYDILSMYIHVKCILLALMTSNEKYQSNPKKKHTNNKIKCIHLRRVNSFIACGMSHFKFTLSDLISVALMYGTGGGMTIQNNNENVFIIRIQTRFVNKKHTIFHMIYKKTIFRETNFIG